MTFLLALMMKAHAGIRVIHGGGGYAEMKALSLYARLPRLLAAYKDENLVVDRRPLAFAEEDPKEHLVIPGASLYDDHKQPLPLREIALRVFRAATGAPAQSAERLFATLEETSVDLATSRLHLLTLTNEVLILRETDDRTEDLTSTLVNQLACGTQPRFVKIEGAHVENAFVTARATYRCGSRNFIGRMILDLRGNPATLRMTAVRIERCRDGI